MQNRSKWLDNAAMDALFLPKAIAVIGASPKRGLPRNTLIRVLQRHGFAGSIYPVNPNHAEIEGIAAYPSIEAIPDIPDLAMIITPAETVAGLVAACGRKGIRAAIVYSAGFEEVESGKQHALDLAAAAREHGVTVLGPNCQGLWSLHGRAIMSFSNAALAAENLRHAPIAVVSQSGALSGAIGSYLQKSGIGCSYIVSVGNETCIDLVDVLAWVVRQDDVRVVALYFEGLNDASRILGVASLARERGVQIVALKAGRSEIGQQATASHTGKIASAHAVYSGVLDQAGIISVSTLSELLAAVEVLGFMPPPRVSGDPQGGIAVLSSSGGAGALLADQSEEFGIPMTEFSAGTAARLDGILPEFARKSNPVDLTGQMYSIPNLFENACEAIGNDPRTEAVIIQFASSGLRNLQDLGAAFRHAAQAGGYPMIISFVAETLDRETKRQFRDAGILLADDTAVAMRALSWLYQRQRFSERAVPGEHAALPARPVPTGWPEIMQFCEDSGISPARWIVLGAGTRAAEACADMTYPLVVKVLPEDCEHKTELGLVKLRVRTPEEVDAHAAAFRRQLGRSDLGVLVQEMVDGGVEVVLSCLRDADFGPILSIGMGGVAIELFRDVAHLALPVTEDQVRSALTKLKLWTLLQGFRGQPRADVDALARVARRFGDMFVATSALTEFEINPLFVRPDGQGVVAVDALLAAAARLVA